MRLSVNIVAALSLAATFAVATAVSANAECKRYGFTVNDYGKDGPTADAKSLLDKLIATKMTERGVSDYRTGKKSVSCELFLNFIVFDEHTCTAEATVCWGSSKLPGGEQAAADDAAPAKVEKVSEQKPAKKKASKEAAVDAEPAPVVHKTAAQPIPDPKSLLPQKKKSANEASASAPVVTGSLSEAPAKKHKSHSADDGSAQVAPLNDGGGYPTPQVPTDGGGQ